MRKKKRLNVTLYARYSFQESKQTTLLPIVRSRCPKVIFSLNAHSSYSLSLSRGFSSSRSFERDSNNLTELKKIFEIFSIFSHCRISNRYFFFFSSSQLIANCSIMFEFVFYSNSFFVLISFLFFVYLFFRCFILQADFTTLSLSPSLLPPLFSSCKRIINSKVSSSSFF